MKWDKIIGIGCIILLFSKFLFDIITNRDFAVILFDIYMVLGFPILLVKIKEKEKNKDV